MEYKNNLKQNNDIIYDDDDKFEENQMNRYNLNSGTFNQIRTSDQSDNLNTGYVNSYVNSDIDGTTMNNKDSYPAIYSNQSRIVNNKLYGRNEKNEEDSADEHEENSRQEVLPNQNSIIRQKEELYFQTKIRNTGFWGTVCDLIYTFDIP